MKLSTLLFFLLAGSFFFSCNHQKSCVKTDYKAEQIRFDSAYHYVVNNMLMFHEKKDTLLALCDELTCTSPAHLQPRQLRLWAYSFALSASANMNCDNLEKTLQCLERGISIADSLGDIECLNRIMGMQALVYSNWKLNDEANQLFDKVIVNSNRNDVLSMANIYLAKANHLVYNAKYDSAYHYLKLIDGLGIKKEDMLSGSYRSTDYTMRLLKGWCLTEIPDSLDKAIVMLQGLYDEYHPYRRQMVAFETVCFRLGRAYELSGKVSRAKHYYAETVSMVIAQPTAYQLFEVTDPLMESLLRLQDTKLSMQLLPYWKKITDQYYDNQLRGMLAYYSVKLDVTRKEKLLAEVKGDLARRQTDILILVFMVVLLIFLIVGGLFYWLNKRRQMRTLFNVLMRRYTEWREVNEHLILIQDKPNMQVLEAAERNSAADHNSGESQEQAVAEDFYYQLYCRVLLVMEKERPFLNSELTIHLLAKMAATNRTHLSIAINRMTGNNFSVWLSEYRVNYAIHLINSEKNCNIDLLYEQAGFGSRTTFYRQFKQVTGLTPKQFIKQRNN